MECQRIICDREDICFIKIGAHVNRYNWLLGSVYMNCEGIRGEENVLKMRCVKEVISKAKEDGLNIMIGGDMNAHIWELDKCENKNGKLRKSVMDEINLQILNCVWDSIKGATWFSENSEFTLDYVCVNDSALKCVESAYILERGEVVESDHAAVGVNDEWKVRRKGKCRMKGNPSEKRRLTTRNWESFGSQMKGRDYEDLSSMNVAMAQVGEELNEEMDNW